MGDVRTSDHGLQTIADQEWTPTRRHEWWRTCLNLSKNDEGVEEHSFLSQLIETAVQFDAFNVGELQCMEAIGRRYQLWETFYEEALNRSQVRSDTHNAMQGDVRGIFLGDRHSRALALVCPALSEHVAEELKSRALLLKERRKAREEQSHLRAKDKLGHPTKDLKKDKKGKGWCQR